MKAPFALAIVAAALLGPALAHAAPAAKRPVYVVCTVADSDEVGKALCSSLRDVIAKSPRYELLTSPGKEFHNIISITSAAIDAEDSASSVVFAWVVGADSRKLLTHEVLVTGIKKVDAQAASLLVDLDTLIDSMLKNPKP